MCELVEVFSVAYVGGDGAAPSGKISVYDGKRGQIIYRRCDMDKAVSSHSPSDSGAQNGRKIVQLPVTGPYHAISADGCVAIELDLHHGCQASSLVAEILIDIYDDSTEYDVAVTKVVKTCTCHESPSAVVKYAILSNAVEAVVEVKLRRRDAPTGCCYVKGKITALSDLGEVVLFESNDENKLIETSRGLTTILLTRSVIAVPTESSLMIKVDLHIRPTGEIVEDSVVCQTDLDSEHHLVGKNDKVHVNITFSD